MPSSKEESTNPLVVFLNFALKSVVFTALWLPVFGVRCLIVKFIETYKKTYGKILNCFDAPLEENFTEEPPKNTIAFTFILDGDIRLKELQQIFTRTVLEATISNKDKKHEDEVRYPEFKQFQVDFAGFEFWKNDPSFNIDNHIFEETYQNRFSSIAKIHQDMNNLTYKKKRSPWEMILVRNYENSANKTLLIWRSHHTLADTKSLLKVLIECFGEKQLKLPNVQYPEQSSFDKVLYYALLPFYFVYCQMLAHFIGLKAKNNPWYFDDEVEPLLNIDISPKMSMTEIKAVAKRHNVAASAVILSIIAGAIRKSDPRMRDDGIPCQYVVPKLGHPDKLANHSYSATMVLPTEIGSPLELLQRCNKIFHSFKTSKLHKYDKVVLFQNGTWFNPLRTKFLLNTTFPLILTNIASDVEGFKVGGRPCSEFMMSCAPMTGASGVIICPFSYKDTIEIGVTAKDGILSESQTKTLATLMGKEFEELKKLTKR